MRTISCPLLRRAVSILLALTLMVSLGIQTLPVLAVSEGEADTVTVTIEKSLGNGTSVFLCEPVQVHCGAGGTIKISDALKAAYAPQTISEGSIYNEIKVQGRGAFLLMKAAIFPETTAVMHAGWSCATLYLPRASSTD